MYFTSLFITVIKEVIFLAFRNVCLAIALTKEF